MYKSLGIIFYKIYNFIFMMFCFLIEPKSLVEVQIIKTCHLKSIKVFPKWVENLAKNFVMIWWKVNLVFHLIAKVLFWRTDQWIVRNTQRHLMHHDPSEELRTYNLVTFGIPINWYFAWIRTIRLVKAANAKVKKKPIFTQELYRSCFSTLCRKKYFPL